MQCSGALVHTRLSLSKMNLTRVAWNARNRDRMRVKIANGFAPAALETPVIPSRANGMAKEGAGITLSPEEAACRRTGLEHDFTTFGTAATCTNVSFDS